MPETEELAQTTYRLYEQSMETHYSEIIKFLAIVIPSLTAFFYMIYQYQSTNTGSTSQLIFFSVTIAIIIIQTWAAIYALAMSYRYRYLQLVVSKIESYFNMDKLLPKSFKLKKIQGWNRIKIKIAPELLQVHVYFFVIVIIGVGIVSASLLSCYCIWIILSVIISIILIWIFGAWYYPKQLNKLHDEYN